MITEHTFSSPISSAACADSRPIKQEDLDRVCRTRQGSREAFNELVLAYQGQVYNLAYWMLGDEDAAEDAAQEAFYRAYCKINTFDGLSFRAWVLRIATNYCLDRLRRKKRHPLVSLDSSEQDPDDLNENCVWLVDSNGSPEQIVERADRCAMINQCLMALTPEFRAPIILVDVQEMSYQEAAGILNLPLGSFKSRLSRARAKLIEIIYRSPGSDQIL